MRSMFFRWVCLGLLALSSLQAQAPALIPRKAFFSGVFLGQPNLSPDGTRLAYLAPGAKGAPNLWIRSLDKADAAAVTENPRGIFDYQWAADGRHLLYFQDKDGDEVNHLYALDLATRVIRDLTPFVGIQAENLIVDPAHPRELLVGLNLRNRALFDMYRVDLATGALKKEVENPGDVIGWTADEHFVIRAATAFRADTCETVVRVRKDARSPWRNLITMPFERGLFFGQVNGGSVVLGFADQGRSLDVVSALHSDLARAERLDATTGRLRKVLAAHPQGDVAGFVRPLVLRHPATGALQAVQFEHLHPEWRYLDPRFGRELEAQQTRLGGVLTPISRDLADRYWVLAQERDNAPVRYLLLDRTSGRTETLSQVLPDLASAPLPPRKALRIPARDGRELVCYLTLPAGAPPRNLPLVLNPHGGPWTRDHWGFDLESAFLANRGYAVLQVNFRGSAGLGVSFLNAGNHEMGEGMQQDMYDAVDWVIAQGIADPKRVAVSGTSAGGYAVLRALTQSPERFCCGVDLVGPSDLATLIATMPPSWAPVKQRWLRRIGDVEKDPELNRKLSPLYHIDRLQAPLLIGQGANDPRVKVQHSEAIVAAARAKGLKVTYLLCPDEGHGFTRDENNLDYFGRVEAFLAEHLGGRAEPLQPIPGSSLEVH